MDIHDYQHMLSAEPIQSIQIHLHQAKDMVFLNTFLRETAKMIVPHVAPTFVMHSNPITTYGHAPFCILNQKHIKGKA